MENNCPTCAAATRMVFRADHCWGECPACGEYWEEYYDDEA